MNIQKFVRKPFFVDAIQVTKENLEEVATWCEGQVCKDESSGQPYIQVNVFNPTEVPDHSRAYVGRWILKAATGYKVYKTKGFFPRLRFFGYPTPTWRYRLVAGKSTTKDERYVAEWSERGLLDGRVFVLASALHERDSTERFFGFGNSSHEASESNYTGNDSVAQVTPGVWLLPRFALSYGMRIRRFKGDDIAPGKTVSGTVVMEADFSHQIDNMEGLDAFTAEDGSTHLIVVSDDNHSLIERKLLLEFKLVE